MINIQFASPRIHDPYIRRCGQSDRARALQLVVPCGSLEAVFMCYGTRVRLEHYRNGQQFAEGQGPVHPIDNAQCDDLWSLQPSESRVLNFVSRFTTGTPMSFRLLQEYHPANSWAPRHRHWIGLSDETGGMPLWPFRMMAFGNIRQPSFVLHETLAETDFFVFHAGLGSSDVLHNDEED